MLRTSDDRVDRGNDAPDEFRNVNEIAPADWPWYPRHSGLKVALVDDLVAPVDDDGELFL